MSAAKLDAFRDDIAARKTQDLLVIRNDAIVLEWYAQGRSASDKHGTASLAKAVVGGLSLAIALNDGRLKLDDPVSKYVPKELAGINFPTSRSVWDKRGSSTSGATCRRRSSWTP